jgi:hypothetical protein
MVVTTVQNRLSSRVIVRQMGRSKLPFAHSVSGLWGKARLQSLLPSFEAPKFSMLTVQKQSFAVTALVSCALALSASCASALTAEVAKKCRAFAIKAHPPVVAGSKTGSEQAQRAYFRDCVAKDGDVEEPKGAEAPKDRNIPRK